MKTQQRGHCPHCGREQAVLKGSGHMSKHGYKVDNGYFTGTCTGQFQPPVEHDIQPALDRIEEIKSIIDELTTRLSIITEATGAWYPEMIPVWRMESFQTKSGATRRRQTQVKVHYTQCTGSDMENYRNQRIRELNIQIEQLSDLMQFIQCVAKEYGDAEKKEQEQVVNQVLGYKPGARDGDDYSSLFRRMQVVADKIRNDVILNKDDLRKECAREQFSLRVYDYLERFFVMFSKPERIRRFGYETTSSAGSPQEYFIAISQITHVNVWYDSHGNPSYCYHLGEIGKFVYVISEFGGMNELGRMTAKEVSRKKDLFY